MHAVFVLQDVGTECAVLPPTAGNHAVVGAVVAPVLVQQLQKLSFAIFPNDILFLLGETAGIAHAFTIEVDGTMEAVRCVLEFDARTWALVGYHTSPAIVHVDGKPVFCALNWVREGHVLHSIPLLD